MPRKRWIDKKNAQNFQLLYRSQNDPLLNDDAGDERALFQVSGPSDPTASRQNAGLHIADLERDLDFESMRDNEGEAAEHGVYFDDTNYDYMQHLRDLGTGGGDSYSIDVIPSKVKGKGKGRPMRLEDALREATLDDDEAPSLAEGSFVEETSSSFSRSTKQRTYQNQQDIPDEIAGFQPNMDPRLREVLEALDDDAYVDEQDQDDVFGLLAQDGRNGELQLDEFEALFEGEDEGWESDVTEKASKQPRELTLTAREVGDTPDREPGMGEMSTEDAAIATAEDGDWLRDFAKFKRDAVKKPQLRAGGSVTAASSVQDQAPSLYTLNGTPLRQKKRKGAQTNPSQYSMTSSSLARTDGQQLLDARFDKFEKMYSLDEGDEFDDRDGGMSLASDMSRQSRMSTVSTKSFADDGAVRGDLDGMMDGFLESWNQGNPGGGKRKGAKGKRGKNGNEIHGLKMLDDIRAELGPARMHRTQQA